MKKTFFNMIFIALFISVSFISWSAPTPEEYGAIINLAGRQRMLTQKMAKEALLIFAGIDIEKNREHLAETLGLFIKTLNGLRNGDRSLGLPPTESESIKAKIDAVKRGFDEIEVIFKRIIAGEMPSYDAVTEIAERNPLILEEMNTVVEMFEQELRETIPREKAFLGVEINLSGKQRMLSQKMAKEALLIYLDISRRENKKLLRKTYTLFDKTLKGLKYGDGELGLPGTTEGNIARQLDAVTEKWDEIKPLIEKSCDIMVDRIREEEMVKIANLNVLILDEMDRAVEMYEALAKK